VRELGVDAAAVVAYGQILSRALIDAVPSGWVNLHFSLLPAWRGAAPVQRAIMAGDDVTGATAFVIEPALDEGPVLGALTEAIRPTDTTGDLLGRLADRGAPLLVDAVAGLAGGTLAPVPQAREGVSYAAKVTREDAYARWDRPAHLVDRQVRACTPDPGAWTTLPDGSVAKLGPVTPRPDLAAGVPGTVVADGDRVVVRTGTHPVELSWIAPAGRKAMEAGAWWRGARLGGGAAFPAGALLGEA
jgi:methionyl-tRNA formyltransferase